MTSTGVLSVPTNKQEVKINVVITPTMDRLSSGYYLLTFFHRCHELRDGCRNLYNQQQENDKLKI